MAKSNTGSVLAVTGFVGVGGVAAYRYFGKPYKFNIGDPVTITFSDGTTEVVGGVRDRMMIGSPKVMGDVNSVDGSFRECTIMEMLFENKYLITEFPEDPLTNGIWMLEDMMH